MQHFEHFHREAVKHNLSAGAILLWQQLYFTMERKNQFADLQQSTAVLTAQLQITRQGLAVMRQTLIDRGFLTVRVDEHQQTFYTLMIEGKTVGAVFPRPQSATGTNDSCAMPVGEGSPFPQIMDMAQSVNGTGNPSPTDTHTSCVAGADAHTVSSRPEARQSRSGEILAAPKDFSTSVPCTFARNDKSAAFQSTGRNDNRDLILTNRIRPYIDTFCEQFGPAMKGDLLQWAEMRRKNGWTLTLWGLEELFKKLIALSDGIGAKMAQIVAQSVTRRWKGFFALKVKAKPSGEALRQQEETHQPRPRPWDKPATWQKCRPEGRDLSFLEI